MDANSTLSNSALDAITRRIGLNYATRTDGHAARLSTTRGERSLRYGILPDLSLAARSYQMPGQTWGHEVEHIVHEAFSAVELAYGHTPAGEVDLLSEDPRLANVDVKASRGSNANPERHTFSGLHLDEGTTFVFSWIDPRASITSGRGLVEALRFGYATSAELVAISEDSEYVSSFSVNLASNHSQKYRGPFGPERSGDIRWLLQEAPRFLQK